MKALYGAEEPERSRQGRIAQEKRSDCGRGELAHATTGLLLRRNALGGLGLGLQERADVVCQVFGRGVVLVHQAQLAGRILNHHAAEMGD